MRFFRMPVFLAGLLLTAGCTTSRVIRDTSAPEIVIDRFGDLSFRGERIEIDKVAPAVAAAGIPRSTKVRVRIAEQCDRAIMGKVAGRLHTAGYGTIFVTDWIATASAPKIENPASPTGKGKQP